MYMSCGRLESVHYRNPISEASGISWDSWDFLLLFLFPQLNFAGGESDAKLLVRPTNMSICLDIRDPLQELLEMVLSILHMLPTHVRII